MGISQTENMRGKVEQRIIILEVGSNRNPAGGEQVHFSRTDNNSKWACEFWVAGMNENSLEVFIITFE